MGDGDGRALDADDDHVGVGRADVVLDHEATGAAHRRRIETGMVEFQRARAFEPAHEGGDERLVLGAKSIGERAGDGVLGALRGEPVERLVQIHHQTMQAVGLADRDEPCDAGLGDALAGRIEPGADGGEAALGGLAESRITGSDSLDHGVDVGQQRFVQLGKARRLDQAAAVCPGADDQRPRGDRVDAGATAFGCEIGRRTMRIMGVLNGRLQNAHAKLGPLVRAQGIRHQIRQHQFHLAKLFDDARFHDVSGSRKTRGLRCHEFMIAMLRQISRLTVTMAPSSALRQLGVTMTSPRGPSPGRKRFSSCPVSPFSTAMSPDAPPTT